MHDSNSCVIFAPYNSYEQNNGTLYQMAEIEKIIYTESVEQKKQRLAKELVGLRESWEYTDKVRWCLANGYNPDSLTRGYLQGGIGHIPVAEALIAEIKSKISQTTFK